MIDVQFIPLQTLSGSTTTGAMTYSLILALESEPGITYGRLLYSMRSVIRGASAGANARLTGPVGSFVRKVLKSGLRQVCPLKKNCAYTWEWDAHGNGMILSLVSFVLSFLLFHF